MKLNRSHYISITIAILLTIWLISGQLGNDTPQANTPTKSNETNPLESNKTVQVRIVNAEEVSEEIIIQGHTEPGRFVTLRAEVAGKITAITTERGQLVKEDNPLLQIDIRDWEAKLAQANALIRQRELEYAGIKKLTSQGHASQTKLAEARTLLETARAEAKNIQIKLNATLIKAPFNGVLETRPVELGDYVKEGDVIATVLDFSPYIISGEINEKDAPKIKLGDNAQAQLVTGKTVSGTIRYIASNTNSATRTFTLELEVANPENLMMSGITAEIRIPLTSTKAHRISPALLNLNNKGKLGIKLLENNNQVKFYPVNIIRSETLGVWITGLPDTAHIITVGQGYVEDGDTVNTVYDYSAWYLKTLRSKEIKVSALLANPFMTSDKIKNLLHNIYIHLQTQHYI